MEKLFTRILRVFHFSRIIFLLFPMLFFSCFLHQDENEHPTFFFQVSEDYSEEGATRWLLISRTNGEPVFASAVTNGQTITLPITDHLENERFVFTDVYHTVATSGEYSSHTYSLTSYADIAPGTYILDNNYNRTAVGTSNLIITNHSEQYYRNSCFGHDLLSTSEASIDDEKHYFITLGRQPVDLVYCVFSQDPESSPLYARIENVMAGETESIDFSVMKPMENKKIVDLPGADHSSYSIQGIGEPGKYANRDYLYGDDRNSERPNPEQLPIWFPNDLYQEIMTTITYGKGDYSYSYTYLGTEPPSAVHELEADIATFDVSGDQVTLKTTGSFDYAGISAYRQESAPQKSAFYHWVIRVPGKPESNFTIPTFPAELTSAMGDPNALTFEFSRVALYDFNGLNNYDDLISKTLILNEELYKTSKQIKSKFRNY
jgi:hypothetical protein